MSALLTPREVLVNEIERVGEEYAAITSEQIADGILAALDGMGWTIVASEVLSPSSAPDPEIPRIDGEFLLAKLIAIADAADGQAETAYSLTHDLIDEAVAEHVGDIMFNSAESPDPECLLCREALALGVWRRYGIDDEQVFAAVSVNNQEDQ